MQKYLVRSELCPYIWTINEQQQTPTTMTTQEAVERSISHTEIVHIEAADKAEAKALIAELSAIALEAGLGFDCTDSNDGYQTWAYEDGTENEMVWRVHIEVEAQ